MDRRRVQPDRLDASLSVQAVKQGGILIRIGVIGYGYWGPNLVRNCFEAQGAQVACVSDLRADRLALVSSRYPTIQTTQNFRELIEDPSIDAVVIATPVSTHYELASARAPGRQARTGRETVWPRTPTKYSILSTWRRNESACSWWTTHSFTPGRCARFANLSTAAAWARSIITIRSA